ncbi:hypothetical protein SAMN05192574_10912 [Mucilaginibacter gossypiicola]|uniref:DUF4595 domain-containing protein n=1 Tax=Mucilaginibacter gossypiicola TaxID=551995 RepID=A0A1H8QHR1_9SPHI|nr:hypothetical protein [Mucilaginibacter gossypiicola]SEO53765.1 hypothetical protein SAMN05192574_10912 [Mucilaginibacter gossypiicola]
MANLIIAKHTKSATTSFMKQPVLFGIKKCLAIAFVAVLIASCKKDDNAATNTTPLSVSKVNYQWGDLAINKKFVSDVVKYTGDGKVDSVISFDENGTATHRIGFTYAGSNLTLNTNEKDSYKLDNEGRVVYHNSEEVQNGNNIKSMENFSYDANGYLNKVTMSIDFDNKTNSTYSVINYEVKNGNYSKFTLSNTDGGLITRQYSFNYNTAVKVLSPVALFAPIFATNTTSNVDKYLNYGKGSKNLLNSIDYVITNLDKTVSKGSFKAVSKVNKDNYITELVLDGASLTAFPSDNISPLPRSMQFTLK